MRLIAAVTAAFIPFAASTASACDTSSGTTQEHVGRLLSCISKLEADIVQLTKQVANLQTQLNHMHTTQSTVVVRRLATAGPAGGLANPLGSSLVQCPPGSWVSGIQVVLAEVPDLPAVLRPLGELRYSCRPLR